MGSRDILQMKAQDMTGYSYLCDCGRTHSVDIKKISVGKGAVNRVPELLAEYKDEKIILVSDKNTWEIAGEKVFNILQANGF